MATLMTIGTERGRFTTPEDFFGSLADFLSSLHWTGAAFCQKCLPSVKKKREFVTQNIMANSAWTHAHLLTNIYPNSACNGKRPAKHRSTTSGLFPQRRKTRSVHAPGPQKSVFQGAGSVTPKSRKRIHIRLRYIFHMPTQPATVIVFFPPLVAYPDRYHTPDHSQRVRKKSHRSQGLWNLRTFDFRALCVINNIFPET